MQQSQWVKQAAVHLYAPPQKEATLVAYGIPANSTLPAAAWTHEVKNHLKAQLPPYMVPPFIIPVPEFTVNHAGKMVWAKMPLPGQEARAQELEKPTNETEKKLQACWLAVLPIAQVGVADNFFDAGGNSLLIIELHAHIAEAFTTTIKINELFDCPTIRQQARLINQKEQSLSEQENDTNTQGHDMDF